MSVVEFAPRPASSRRTLTVSVAAEHDAQEWDRFVTEHSGASGYHAWAWRGVFARAFGHESIYLMARDGARLAGVLPLVFIDSVLFGRSLTSLPFLNYGGIAADSPEAAAALIDHAASVVRERRCRHVELRHIARQFPDLPCKQHKVTMMLPLEMGMWDKLDRKVRNQVRKAQKSDLVSEHGGVELLADFYRVFVRNMRDLGTPVLGSVFFREVLQAFPDRARIHVVRLQGAAVAAGMTYRTAGTVEVPWASSIRTYNHLCPNHLLYWSVIEEAVRTGATRLDFGRSTPNEGTFKFKEQWGAEPVPLSWEYYLADGGSIPDATPANPKFRLAIAAWKKLPLPVTTLLGPRIVRGIP
jgi:FemAB-related protein (PEP-CTERM system-associated)